MHEVLVNRLGGLSLPRKSVVRLTDRPDMTLDVYRGRKTTMQQLHCKIAELKSLHEGRGCFWYGFRRKIARNLSPNWVDRVGEGKGKENGTDYFWIDRADLSVVFLSARDLLSMNCLHLLKFEEEYH